MFVDWIVGVGIAVILLMVMYFIAFNLVNAIIPKFPALIKKVEKDMWFGNIILAPVVIIESLVLIAIASNGAIDKWGFIFPDWLELFYALLVGSVAAVVANAILFLSSGSESAMKKEMDIKITKENFLPFVGIIVVLASLTEEIAFRGFLQKFIDNSDYIALDVGSIPITSGCIIGAILFGLVHLSVLKRGKEYLIIAHILLGLVAGIYYTITGSLLVPFLIHAEFNIIGIIFCKIQEFRLKEVVEVSSNQ